MDTTPYTIAFGEELSELIKFRCAELGLSPTEYVRSAVRQAIVRGDSKRQAEFSTLWKGSFQSRMTFTLHNIELECLRLLAKTKDVPISRYVREAVQTSIDAGVSDGP